ncbi:Fucose mutarotase-like [Homarus americanus]|uniref:L-fucose mutarotase n=1 Tax=Homarus americanus TaxID=6706 RepID=A0A8J5K187_HOMAM|nr:Fucose mutarotase-like [Homarus americanus]
MYVLADINFPTHTICSKEGGPKEYRADGLSIPVLLDAILTLMPLDTYSKHQVQLMDKTASDKAKGLQVPIWEEYRKICDKHQQPPINREMVERFEFYEKAKKAYAIIHTGETAAYGNILLKRGVC